jgi:hypothetical protein
MGQVIEFSDWQAIGKAATTVVEDSRRRSWARAREEGALRPEARRMADAIGWGTRGVVAHSGAQAFHVVSNNQRA